VTGPGFDPQAPPRYDPIQGYGDSSSYRNPYEANPYQPSFGGVSPYGAQSTQIPTPHPQAALALVLGILGTVLGLGCIVGGLVGIGGIVLGRRVKNEIDAEPGRYTGRSQAVAGLITGHCRRIDHGFGNAIHRARDRCRNCEHELLTDTSIREL
jgi:hypothetical protein